MPARDLRIVMPVNADVLLCNRSYPDSLRSIAMAFALYWVFRKKSCNDNSRYAICSTIFSLPKKKSIKLDFLNVGTYNTSMYITSNVIIKTVNEYNKFKQKLRQN